MTYQSVNPYDGKLLKTFEEQTDDQLETAIATAEACFQAWRGKTFPERAAIVGKVAELMDSKVEELALPTVGEAHMMSDPIGVIFCVEPWNFPYYQLARVAGPHLMAGNVLMVKHAANVPQSAIAFEQLWIEAGAPVGLYTNLLVSHDQANQIVDDPRIKGVALTGSAAAGRSIAARAGQNLKPSSLELGGSDAFIVLDDADLDDAVKWAVWGRMYNDGQTCVAAKRFIVAEGLADAFLEKFQAALTALEPGDPMDPNTTLGPLSTEAALLDLLKLVDGAVSNGARVVMGGKRIERPGSFMQPTILTDIAPENPAFRQEFFGAWRAHRPPRRNRHDVHQQHRLVRCRAAVRWHQELRLRARARRQRHPGVREQEAGSHRVDGCAGMTHALRTVHHLAGATARRGSPAMLSGARRWSGPVHHPSPGSRTSG